MLTFFEYIVQNRKVALPDAHTMLGLAGVPLASPDKEETQRLLNQDRRRYPVGGKALKTIVRLDSQPPRQARKRS